MSDTYQVCESCTHRFAVPIGARASKCETCASLDRKDAEITRLHAEAAELRAQLTQSSQAMFDAGAMLSAKQEEVIALRADLARVEGERDSLLGVRITISTPHDVCDGDVTLTIGESIKQYGHESLAWTHDWAAEVKRLREKVIIEADSGAGEHARAEHIAKERDSAKAEVERVSVDNKHLRLALDRLLSASSEQQHTLASKGWNTEAGHNAIDKHWSVAGARRHQWREVDAACIDARDVLDGKHLAPTPPAQQQACVLCNGVGKVNKYDDVCTAVDCPKCKPAQQQEKPTTHPEGGSR